jgi:putative transposase
MLHQLYYHIVWTTRGRRPTISREIAVFLDRLLRTIARQERTALMEIGMVTTHVHLLVRAHPMTVIPRLLQRLKGVSAALAGKELHLPPERQLRWAPGYTIQSVSRPNLGAVRAYVRGQPGHHPHEVIPGWNPVFTAAPETLEVRNEESLWCMEQDEASPGRTG